MLFVEIIITIVIVDPIISRISVVNIGADLLFVFFIRFLLNFRVVTRRREVRVNVLFMLLAQIEINAG